jgi:hypothetical protein
LDGSGVDYDWQPWSDVVGATQSTHASVEWEVAPRGTCRAPSVAWSIGVDGVVRRGDGSFVGRAALPPLREGAQREITAQAAHASGRLAVIVTDSLRVSVGQAPCCTRVLLFAPPDCP